MRTKNRLVSVACLIAIAGSAMSQEKKGDTTELRVSQIDEVIVTAQRREENLQLVPFAVTAIDEKELIRRQVNSINQISSSVPNLNYNSGPGQATSSKIFYRGIGEDEALFTTDTPVGVYIDDVYIPRTTGSMFDLYGVERVEFLRGPQGTLYGRNTSAGALKIVTKKPSKESNLQADVKFGNYDRKDFTVLANIPLANRLYMQVSGLRRSQEGSTTNLLNGQKVNDQDVWAGRASVLYEASDDLDILITGDRIRERSIAGELIALQAGYEPGRLNLNGDDNFRTVNSDLNDPIDKLDQGGVSGTISWRTPFATFKSISSARKMYNKLLIDLDGRGEAIPGTGLPLFHLFQDQHQSQFSEELQASGSGFSGKLKFVTGAYFFHERNRQTTANLIFCGLDSCDYTQLGLSTNSLAFYGNLNYAITEALTLTTGLRWTRDTKHFDLDLFAPDHLPRLNPDGSPVVSDIEKSWSAVTPRFAVDYKIGVGTWSGLLYANAAKGFKSGSFDGRAADAVTINSLKPVDPETNWNFEGGVKSDLLDRRLRLNVNYYWAKFKNLQLGIARENQPNTRFNAGDVRVKGVEIEATAVPIEGLEITGNIGTISGEYTRIAAGVNESCSNANAIPLTADELTKLKVREAPAVTSSLGANYTFPVVSLVSYGRGNLTLGANFSHTARHFHDFCNSRNIETQPYSLLAALVTYETEDGRWRVSVGGTNLLNKDYIIQGFNVGNGPDHFIQSAAFGEPRKYGATIAYKMH